MVITATSGDFFCTPNDAASAGISKVTINVSSPSTISSSLVEKVTKAIV